MRAYYEGELSLRLWRLAKRRAATLGAPFDISPGDLDVPEKCPVLGIPIRVGPNGGDANSPSVDRIIPELGYVTGNVAVISKRANRLKGQTSVEDLEAILAYIQKGAPN